MRCSGMLSIGWLALVLLISVGMVCAAPVHDLAGTGNVPALEALLAGEPSAVNARDAAGATPLHWAADRGRTDAARILIERGADVNARNNRGVTPLHVAAAFGRLEVIRLLLDHGADAEVIDAKGRTPLTVAQERGQLGAADALRATAVGIVGTVSDPDGRPVAGAAVALSPGDFAATTGSDGSFAFRALPPGEYVASVSAAGFQTQSREGIVIGTGETVTLAIALLPTTATLTGAVRDRGGKPVAGAAIRLEPGGRAATTGPDGSYGVSGIEPGSYTVRATSHGMRPETRTGVGLQAGQTTSVDLTLRPSLGVVLTKALGWVVRLLLVAAVLGVAFLLLPRALALLKARAVTSATSATPADDVVQADAVGAAPAEATPTLVEPPPAAATTSPPPAAPVPSPSGPKPRAAAVPSPPPPQGASGMTTATVPAGAAAAMQTPGAPVTDGYPWETRPSLLARVTTYDAQGTGSVHAGFCGEYLNGIVRSECLARMLDAEVRVYPDALGVTARPGCLDSLLMRVPPLLRGILGFLFGFVGMATNPIGCILAIPALIVGLILSIIFLPLSLILNAISRTYWDRVARRIRQDPACSWAIRKLFRLTATVPRYWERGDVVQLVRLDVRRGLKRHAVLLLVQDRPLDASGTGILGAFLMVVRRIFVGERRVFVLRLKGGEADADSVADAAGRILGLRVLRGRFSLAGLVLEDAAQVALPR